MGGRNLSVLLPVPREAGWYISAELEQAMHKTFLGVKGMTLLGEGGSNFNGSPATQSRKQYSSSAEGNYLLEA